MFCSLINSYRILQKFQFKILLKVNFYKKSSEKVSQYKMRMKTKQVVQKVLIFVVVLFVLVINTPIHTISIPKILWSYSITPNSSFPHQSFSSPLKEFYFLNRLNNIHMANLQNYTVNYVSDKNYSNYLSQESLKKIDHIVDLFGKRFHGEESTKMYDQMVNEANNVTKRLVVYFLIKEHGGVFIDDMVTLVQPLESFFADINTNRDINTGNPSITSHNSHCIVFHNDKYSSLKQKVTFLQRDFSIQKQVVRYPNIQDYFMGCEKNSLFIEKVLQIYIDLLINEGRSDWLGKLDRNEKMIGMVRISRIYQQGHVMAAHIVLQQREVQLSSDDQKQQLLAIDYFQLKTLNYRLGPSKLSSQFFFDEYKLIAYLTKLTVHQMEVFIGRLRYVFLIEQKLIRLLSQRLKMNESQTEYIVDESFVDKYWLRMVKGKTNVDNFKYLGVLRKGLETYSVMKNSKTNISNIQHIQSKQNPLLLPPLCSQCHHRLVLDQSLPQWQTLPRNIWIIWDNGIQKSNFIVQMSYENLKLSALNSNFTINLVSKQNVHNFISKQLIDKINNAINNAAFDIGNQAISDLWRLALIYEHGGVYLDASTFQIDQSFDWILNITKFPKNLIWNRYSQQPNVFLLWNTYYGGPLDWYYDNYYHTRSQWHLSYQSNFIAAIKDSQLIKQWFQTMIKWIQMPFDIVKSKMDEVGMTRHSWTHDDILVGPTRYLTVMDAIKFVVARKEMEIKRNYENGTLTTAAQFYKVWSIPGQMLGHLKFRSQTNYENRDYRLDSQNRQLNNVYRYKYPFSYIQGPLGPALFQVKYFGYDLIYMNKYLNDFYLSNRQEGKSFDLKKFESSFHPQSLFSKKLLNRFPNKTIECLEKYSQISQMRTKMKAANKIWTY